MYKNNSKKERVSGGKGREVDIKWPATANIWKAKYQSQEQLV